MAGKIYAIVDKGGKREVKTLAEKLMLPNGIEFHKGSLYVATPKEITRYDNIEDTLDKPREPVMVYDQLPGDIPHGWKFIKFGPDGKLYLPVGAPCNICEPSDSTRRSGASISTARAWRSWRAACAIRWGSTSIPRPRSSGSPTTSGTGCRRIFPLTS